MAQTADSVIVALEAQLGGFTPKVKGAANDFEQSMSKVERSANRAEASVARSATGVVNNTARMANASRNLGRQFADVGSSLASGSSPFIILAQQAPQVADALADTGGRAASVAAFFAGPFGAALLAAASVAGVLAANFLSAGDAADSKKKATDALKDAVDRLNGSAATLNNTTLIGIRNDISAAETLRVREIRTRRLVQAQLELARANATEAAGRAIDPTLAGEGGFNAGAIAQARFAGEVTSLSGQIAAQDAKIIDASRAIAAGKVQIALRNVAGATDKAAAATDRYENRLDFLQRQFERGFITEQQFTKGALAATRARDAATAATKAQGSISTTTADAQARLAAADTDVERASAQLALTRAEARRELNAGTISQDVYTARLTAAQNALDQAKEGSRSFARGIREAAQAAKELESKLDSLIQRLDPLQAGALAFVETLKEIEEVRLGGLLSDADAVGLKLAAAANEAKRLSDANAATSAKAFGSDTTIEDAVEGIDRRRQIEFDLENELALKRQDNVLQLAELFETALTGGSDALWEKFKRDGLAAVALIAAQLVLAQLDGKSGTDFGSILSEGLTLLAGGRASGGPVQGGKLYRVNEGASQGSVEGFQPQGSGKIIPLGQMKAATAGGGATVINAPQFNLRGAIVTRELYADMQRISNESAAAAGQQAYRASMRDAPSAVSKAQRYGTPL